MKKRRKMKSIGKRVKKLGRIGLFISLLLWVNFGFSQPLGTPTPFKAQSFKAFEYVPGEILVKFKEQRMSFFAIKSFNASLEVTIKKMLYSRKKPTRKTYLLKLPSDLSVPDAVSIYKSDPSVEYAEPNYIYHLMTTEPDELEFSNQWYLHNTGQIVEGLTGTENADIDAPEAWDITTGSQDVVIAVIDSGVDLDHPDLQPNLIPGWDFVDNDNEPNDFVGHGTHCAGIIGAKGNNAQFISGINWNVKIMPLRVGGISIGPTTDKAISAINYAVDNGAHIINASWGNNNYSNSLYEAISNANDYGVLFVAAAGNDGNNNDANPVCPASYDLPNIISVAATNQKDELSSGSWSSNYGANSVDVAAPGGSGQKYNMVSTYPTITEDSDGTETLYFQNFEGAEIPDWYQGGTPTTWDYRATGVGGSICLEDSPDEGKYPIRADSWVGYGNPFTRVKESRYILKFSMKHILETMHAALLIYGSPPDSPNWNKWGFIPGPFYIDGIYDPDDLRNLPVEGITGSSGGNFLIYREIDAPKWARIDLTYLADMLDQFCFGFNLISDDSTNTQDGVYIDDIYLYRIPLFITKHTTAYKSGTSMAAPVVSGIAGLVKAMHPSWTASDIKKAICSTVDYKGYPVLTGGRVNAYKAVTYTPPSPPPSPSGGGGGGGGGGCFIATATYGTAMTEEVKVLKKFRDEKLIKTIAGRNFVKLYYKVSPPIADFIRNKPLLRRIVRGILRPIVSVAKKIY